MNINRKLWYVGNGMEIYLFTLSNDHVELNCSSLGCTITSIKVSGKHYKDKHIVLGYDSAEEYLEDPYYMGCIVGRFAGRIKGASFDIEEKKYLLSPNETRSGHHLHGGDRGFNRKIFTVSDSECNEELCFIRLEATSSHMEEGYPGDLRVSVLIELNKKDEINITYEAHTNKPTHVNLTHHHYFNLGEATTPGTRQELVIYADEYLGQDEYFIPDGTFRQVKNSSNDFTKARSVGSPSGPGGFNEYFVLNKIDPGGVDARLRDPSSGLSLDIMTTYPCLVLYSGNYLSSPFRPSQGICLETQFFPDTPNQPYLPSTLLMPGNIYFHETKMALNII